MPHESSKEELNARARAKCLRSKERAEAARSANRRVPPLLTTPIGNDTRMRQIKGPMVVHLVAVIESVGLAKMELRGL